jgi:hypothetical protein
MWVEFKQVNNLTAAKEWKRVFEDEGIPCRFLPPKGMEEETYRVLIPKDKEHLVKEILRRI